MSGKWGCRLKDNNMAETKKILLSQYKYKNNKDISLYFVDPVELEIFHDDVLLLEFNHGEGKEKTGIHLRIDEAIVLSKLLNEAVHKTVIGYITEL